MGINLPKARAIKLLKRSLLRARDLTPGDFTTMSGAYQKWQLDTSKYIERIFGDESQNAGHFRSVTDSGSYRSEIEAVVAQLASMIEEIEEFGDNDDSSQSRPAQASDARSDKRSVFIVHGHDEAAKHTLKDFLRGLHLNPIVLSDKVSEGNTIIEKFEKYTQVDFAVVLLTPDDLGAGKHDTKMAKRPRQNVIFEFGFFLGKLGRKKVRALVKGGVEMLSDYSGVVYIDLDDGEWKLELAKEMKAAGLVVDMNRLLESH